MTLSVIPRLIRKNIVSLSKIPFTSQKVALRPHNHRDEITGVSPNVHGKIEFGLSRSCFKADAFRKDDLYGTTK